MGDNNKSSDKKVNTSSVKDNVKNKILSQQGHALKAEKLISTPETLNYFNTLTVKYSDMKVIHASMEAESFFAPVLKAAMTPFLLDRLSIFAEQYPTAYSQHIFCGWLTALIARDMKMDGKTATKIVRAALSRDFGLLYLPQNLLDDKITFTSADWNAMRTHSIIGEIIVRDIGELGELESRAILEHHERQDGMGYPKGLKGKDISIAGQILAAVDTVGAIRFKKFENSGRNLRDVYGFIQMNEEAFSPIVIKSLFKILSQTGIEKSMVNPFKTVEQLISHLYVRASAMGGALRMLDKLMEVLLFFESGPKRNELIKVTGRVLKIIHQSGVLDEKMIKWLNGLDVKYDPKQTSLEELSELELLQNELYFHLKRVSDLLQSFHDLEMKKGTPSAQIVVTILQVLSQKNLPRAANGAR